MMWIALGHSGECLFAVGEREGKWKERRGAVPECKGRRGDQGVRGGGGEERREEGKKKKRRKKRTTTLESFPSFPFIRLAWSWR